jgi:hypothetical protein
MNTPHESLPTAEENGQTSRPNPERLILSPRRIDSIDEANSGGQPVPMPREDGQIPSIGASTSHKRRRRRSSKDFLPSKSPSAPVWNWKLVTLGGVLAVLAGSNIMVGRFFYQSGMSEGILRAVDARTPSNESEIESTSTTNKAFAALLNLRGSKPDRPAIEMLTTLALQALSETQNDQLPTYLSQGHTTTEDLCAAYVAMRLGDFGKAAAILRATEPTIPPDLFNYLMNDSVMRQFVKEPRVMGFYEKS